MKRLFTAMTLAMLLTCNVCAQNSGSALIESARATSTAESIDAPESTNAAATLRENSDLRESLSRLDIVGALKRELPEVEIDGTPYFVAEGDLLLDEDQLLLYAPKRAAAQAAFQAGMQAGEVMQFGTSQSELVSVAQNGKSVRWAPGVELTYCVLKNTFGSDGQYQLVVNNMAIATQQWEDLCGVDFRYVPEQDDASGVSAPAGIVFPVRGINADGDFIASAFFPNDPASRRRVLVDPSYFSTTFDKVGVLRHELGHAIGLRHEHIRSEAPAACPNESISGTLPLTAYDPRSVMHYFCGGSGARDLAFTETDREGALKLYGPPLKGMVFVKP